MTTFSKRFDIHQILRMFAPLRTAEIAYGCVYVFDCFFGVNNFFWTLQFFPFVSIPIFNIRKREKRCGSFLNKVYESCLPFSSTSEIILRGLFQKTTCHLYFSFLSAWNFIELLILVSFKVLKLIGNLSGFIVSRLIMRI